MTEAKNCYTTKKEVLQLVNYLSLEQVKALHNLIDSRTTSIKDENALRDALAGPQADNI